MSKIKEEIISLIKNLPENTSLEEIDDLIDFLYVKKQIIEGLEDLNNGRSYSKEEMKQISGKWKSEPQK